MPTLAQTEILVLARALCAAPPAARRPLARALLHEATLADAHRRRTGQAHPRYGDGTLISRLVRLRLPALTDGADPDFLSALVIAAGAVLQHTGACKT